MNRTQKQIFLEGEGDQYFRRNKKGDRTKHFLNEELANMIIELPYKRNENVELVEVGCGDGQRLKRIKEETNWLVKGIDPSEMCIAELKSNEILGKIGTADSIPFEDNSIDILIYGFCLYLCDREDMFKIASEANRVVKKNGWIGIFDFWSSFDVENEYKHREKVISYKTRPEKMFTWHPYYMMTDQKIRSISTNEYTDIPNEWVSSTIIRKYGGK